MQCTSNTETLKHISPINQKFHTYVNIYTYAHTHIHTYINIAVYIHIQTNKSTSDTEQYTYDTFLALHETSSPQTQTLTTTSNTEQHTPDTIRYFAPKQARLRLRN